MIPRLVWIILLALCLSAEGFAAEQEQVSEAPPINPEDRKIVEMLEVLDLMELVEYMEMINDLKAAAEGEDNADKEKE